MVTQPRSQPHPPVTSYTNLIGLTHVIYHTVMLAIRVDGPSIQKMTATMRSEMYASVGIAASTSVQKRRSVQAADPLSHHRYSVRFIALLRPKCSCTS
jgi:hypothetical protein